MSTHAIQKIAQVESISTFLKRLKKKKDIKQFILTQTLLLFCETTVFFVDK